MFFEVIKKILGDHRKGVSGMTPRSGRLMFLFFFPMIAISLGIEEKR
jgi:hypothetical protein